jgi:uncharacterized protein VirK/YbjX
MTTFFRAFATMQSEFRRAKGPAAALKRGLGSLRVLAFPSLMRQMRVQNYLRGVARKRGQDGHPWDPFHFMSHPAYLVNGLTLEQRFGAALHHFRYENDTFAAEMLDQVYSPKGCLLWSAEVDGHSFSMLMAMTRSDSIEGDLNLRLIADGRGIGSLNFVWADSAMFGRPSAPTMFITRSQTHTWPELAIFRSCFKQNSPPYFCLSVASDIARACGMTEIFAVQAEAQISFEPKYASSFRNSYDEFWEKFNAERVTPQAFRLALPLELRDLSELKSKHRSRAEARRRSWGEVGRSAAATLARHLRGGTPPATPAEPAAASGLKVQALCAAAAITGALDSPLVLALA